MVTAGATAVAVSSLIAVVLWAGRDGPPAGPPPGSPASGSGTVSAFVPGTTVPTGAAGIGEGTGPVRAGRRPLRGFSEVLATLTAEDGSTCEVCLMAATTEVQRARGLMEVRDASLGGYDGMAFAYTAPVTGRFYMRNTPLPLSIAFFDERGRFVSRTDMAPCADSPDCRLYPAAAPFTLAVEVPRGDLTTHAVGPGTTIRLGPSACPLASRLRRRG